MPVDAAPGATPVDAAPGDPADHPAFSRHAGAVTTTSSSSLRLHTLDGLPLQGTLVLPEAPAEHAVVLVHGGGATREEGGFLTRLAAGLADTGVTSPRYDLRGHGESDGRPEESSPAAHLNDIRVALAQVHRESDGTCGSPRSCGTRAKWSAPRTSPRSWPEPGSRPSAHVRSR
ncbi:alpha/beta hydrolase [Saccharothrix lopnurensis]|uniref:Alpha/beta hydrolase n=1 Tax=Saccharothrix lopnurensis TaxID=1670621 RepID=A0ABW1NXP1_9PSEU